MIITNNISLSFNNSYIFKNLSFKIEKGENTCVSGPSGKGKSSLLKMLQGYLLPESGFIEIAGMELNIANIKEIRSLMAYVPQNINLPVSDGMELLKLVGVENKSEKVGHFAEKLGIPSGMLDRDFDEMSGGQKQRIVIAVCLSLERDIILLDEPTSSLDNGSIEKLMNLIKEIENKTVVSASHNPLWMGLADKIITL